MTRTVTVVLLDRAGALLGALEPFELALPWWQEVSDVDLAVRRRFALHVSVLRLLDAERRHPPGGAVSYLAQLMAPETLDASERGQLRAVSPELARRALEPHPLRALWAEPGGPAHSLEWAGRELAALGLGELVSAQQQRAWNLSMISRLTSGPGGEHVTWLKQLPPFLAREAAVLRWLGQRVPGSAPPLLAADSAGRQLLGDVPGSDRYDTDVSERARFAELLHVVQRTAAKAQDELAGVVVPDRRGAALARFIRHWLEQSGVDLTPARALLDTLDERVSALGRCGLADSLVHGDFHPGNVRSDGERAAILDWGDAFVGHPSFDIVRLCDGCDEADSARLVAEWCARWRALRPGSEPERAVQLVRPLAALQGAAVYASFVAQIEPSEHKFHADDVPAMIERAAALAAA
jgi:phosphotransferase family enzyme